jgi:hypothetical protein
VLVIEEKGRFKVKELVEVEMLKIVPVVPVETLVITELPKEIEVEVPIKTFWPPVIERPEPTVKSPKVVVPMPPLFTAKTPVQPGVKVVSPEEVETEKVMLVSVLVAMLIELLLRPQRFWMAEVR